jgi:hypothetical protein
VYEFPNKWLKLTNCPVPNIQTKKSEKIKKKPKSLKSKQKTVFVWIADLKFSNLGNPNKKVENPIKSDENPNKKRKPKRKSFKIKVDL